MVKRVLDASVVVKWFFAEEGTDRAPNVLIFASAKEATNPPAPLCTQTRITFFTLYGSGVKAVMLNVTK